MPFVRWQCLLAIEDDALDVPEDRLQIDEQQPILVLGYVLMIVDGTERSLQLLRLVPSQQTGERCVKAVFFERLNLLELDVVDVQLDVLPNLQVLL